MWCEYHKNANIKKDFGNHLLKTKCHSKKKENLFIDNLKKPACASKQEGIVLLTLRYSNIPGKATNKIRWKWFNSIKIHPKRISESKKTIAPLLRTIPRTSFTWNSHDTRYIAKTAMHLQTIIGTSYFCPKIMKHFPTKSKL